MSSRSRRLLLAAASYAGLALVLAGTLGPRADFLVLVIPGFIVLIAGGVGLIALSIREAGRKVPSSYATPAAGPEASTPLPSVTTRGPQSSGLLQPLPTPLSVEAGQLDRIVEFDLTREYQQFLSAWRRPMLIRLGVYVFVILLGAAGLVLGAYRADPVLDTIGGLFLTLGALLLGILHRLWKGADRMRVGPQEIWVRLVPATEVHLAWDQRDFGVILTETPAAVNRARDPPRNETTYRLLFGTGSRLNGGPRVLTEIPLPCVELILAQAQSHGLRIRDDIVGTPGTVSERRVLRITR